jgi:hypothetical protein
VDITCEILFEMIGQFWQTKLTGQFQLPTRGVGIQI